MIARKYRFVIPIVTVVVILGFAEIGARVFGLGDWPPVDATRGFLPFTSMLNEGVDSRGAPELTIANIGMTAIARGRPQFNPRVVPLRKSRNEFRILCLGGSVTYGYPYDDRYSFPRMLEVGLRAVAPAIDWQVINLGAPGYGSYRLRLISAELTRLRPDLVVITSGNNEALEFYLGKEIFRYGKGWAQFRTEAARRSRFISWLVQSADSRRSRTGRANSPGAPEFRPDSSEREQLLGNFTSNIEAMLDLFRDAGAEVYLSTIPVNRRDCPPFGRDAPGEALGSRDAGLVRRYADFINSLRQGRFAMAKDRGEGLLRDLPDCARAWYAYGIALNRLSLDDDAAEAYAMANELDVSVLRAFPTLNTAVAEVARSKGAGLVPFEEAVQSEYPLPGDDAFWDNCHPRLEVTRLLARTLAASLIRDGLVDAPDDWEASFEAAMNTYLDGVELSPLDEIRALMIMLWYCRTVQIQEDKAEQYQARILELDPDGRLLDPDFRRRYIR